MISCEGFVGHGAESDVENAMAGNVTDDVTAISFLEVKLKLEFEMLDVRRKVSQLGGRDWRECFLAWPACRINVVDLPARCEIDEDSSATVVNDRRAALGD